MTKETRFVLPLLLGGAVLYSLFAPAFYVGYFNDDALYILAAKSLTSGHYVALEHPATPPLTDPLPGFPLYLSAFVNHVPSLNSLKTVAVATTLMAGVMMFGLARVCLSPRQSLWATALFVFSPTTILYAATILSESLFISICLGFFVLLGTQLRQRRVGALWLSGALLAWATLIRPQGILLVPAVLAMMIYGRRPRWLIPLLGPVALAWCLVLGRQYHLSHSAVAYASNWRTTFAHMSQGYGTRKLFATLQLLFGEVFLPVPPLFSAALRMVLIHLSVCVGLIVTMVGAVRLTRSASTNEPIFVAGFLFVFLYFLVQVAWLWLTDRYFWPLLPFWLILAVKSVEVFPPHHRKTIGLTLGSLFLVLELTCAAAAYRQITPPQRPPLANLPTQTFGWIRDNTPGSSLFFSPAAPVLYLYTGRHALRDIPAGNPEEFWANVLSNHVTYLLVQPRSLVPAFHATLPHREELEGLWIADLPRAFTRVYSNTTEGSAIFTVTPNPELQAAFRYVRTALADFELSQWEQGFASLETALRLDSNLISARRAYGAGSLLSGLHRSRAIQLLNEAIALQPADPSLYPSLNRLRNVPELVK